MTTEDGDRTYAQAARQRLHEIEAEQLLMEDAVGYFERRWPVPARDS